MRHFLKNDPPVDKLSNNSKIEQTNFKQELKKIEIS